MNNLLLRTYVWAQIWREEDGQDLIEYALVASLIAFAAVTTMGTLATNINTAFTRIASKLLAATPA